MKISARNVLKGKIIKVTSGAVNTEILLELSAENSWFRSFPKNPQQSSI